MPASEVTGSTTGTATAAIDATPKSLLTSKTFLVNLFGAITAITGTLTGVIPPKYSSYVIAAGAIANIGLRLVTNQPVTVPGTTTVLATPSASVTMTTTTETKTVAPVPPS